MSASSSSVWCDCNGVGHIWQGSKPYCCPNAVIIGILHEQATRVAARLRIQWFSSLEAIRKLRALSMPPLPDVPIELIHSSLTQNRERNRRKYLILFAPETLYVAPSYFVHSICRTVSPNLSIRHRY
jgi:hypothetical protein